MFELTQARAAKLARGWVWCAGHAYQQPHPKTGNFDPVTFARVAYVDADGEPMAQRGIGIGGNPHPFIHDHATANGLPSTCRAMWDIPLLYSSPPRGDSREWSVGYDWEDMGSIVTVGRGETETAAWLAACYAAPEPA